MNRTLERALWGRPIALVLGGLAAWLVNPSLRPGSLLTWLIVIFGGAASAIALSARVRRLAPAAAWVSPLVGLLGWAAFATFTGGLASPFVVAFVLEILIAAVSSGPAVVVWVTASALLVMTGVAGLYAFERPALLAVEAAFVVAIGALGVVMSRRRRAGEQALRVQGEELGQRLEALQRALEDERTISRVGENVARLAHGLKNAVHSLRGFVSLIEPQLERGPGTNAALAGLHAAIDDLERLARLTLAPESERAGEATGADGEGPEGRAIGPVGRAPIGADLGRAVSRAREDLGRAHPAVEWLLEPGEGAEHARVAIAEEPLVELTVILMRNAVEAMEGAGRARVTWGCVGGRGVLEVTDEGPGFPPDAEARIFEPGFTTKEGGSGFGLFLARRIVEEHGGSLVLGAAEAGGARVRVELPAAAALRMAGAGG